ncbi:hypothetical protein AVEN_88248-1 [Araneus ventricosus]|uniref:Uncharacterized protein n=1 Tax=Araneus ventricosus TaxID=182803 RepID=A0A4Y2IQ42_ARAVE|nr:hypothetical protein AVEN_88248-1 [Araneus ventricosus]
MASFELNVISAEEPFVQLVGGNGSRDYFSLNDMGLHSSKNCAHQATAICGCGERQPSEVQWRTSARGSLLLDQGIPSASKCAPNVPNKTSYALFRICKSGKLA